MVSLSELVYSEIPPQQRFSVFSRRFLLHGEVCKPRGDSKCDLLCSSRKCADLCNSRLKLCFKNLVL